MFASTLFSWLRQVQQDDAVSGTAFELAFVISQHVNKDSAAAWPTQETLARAVGVSDRSVRDLVGVLVDRGHLAVQVRKGRHQSNVYRLITKSGETVDDADTPENRKPASGEDDQKEEAGFLSKSLKPEASFRHKGQKTGSLVHDNRKFPAKKPEAGFLQNQPHEPTSITSPVFLQKQAAGAASILDIDPKAVLFGEGLTWLAEKTKRTENSLRSALGEMLKLARDNAGVVVAAISDAKRNDRADPVPWVMGVLRARSTLKAAPPTSVPSNFKLSKPAVRA
jgi:hypothetical protein